MFSSTVRSCITITKDRSDVSGAEIRVIVDIKAVGSSLLVTKSVKPQSERSRESNLHQFDIATFCQNEIPCRHRRHCVRCYRCTKGPIPSTLWPLRPIRHLHHEGQLLQAGRILRPARLHLYMILSHQLLCGMH
jgi:hypothetical protein